MKKFTCLFICFIILLSFPMVISSEDNFPWEAEYTRMILQTAKNENTKFVLADVDYNNIPELIAGDQNTVSLYTYGNGSLIKTHETNDIPIEYFVQMKTAQNANTRLTEFLSQIVIESRTTTYKLHFENGTPSLEIIGTENGDGTGSFKGDEKESSIVMNCREKISAYLSVYTQVPFNICVLSMQEIGAATNTEIAAKSLFARYHFLENLSDDTASFTADERDTIKNIVGEGQFAYFEKISHLGNSDIFVQFYGNNPETRNYIRPKFYAVVTYTENQPELTAKYHHESELNIEYLSSLVSQENKASNVFIDYSKTASFRGIDDYVTYLHNLLSSLEEPINENGLRSVVEYMEYAVNLCSRTEAKMKNNTVAVDAYSVSFIAEYAVNCLNRMKTVCDSHNVALNQEVRMIPELVCTNIDLSAPIRIEFEPALSGKLAGASGVRIMLDKDHGIYITAADLATLESSFDTFCMEFIHSENAFSVVFTDKTNQIINYINAPVWFIVPAKSKYSTVMASFQGGTDNWGGQFDANNKRIEFSTNYSGDYQIVENDITINDIKSLPANTQDAIRFLVSKGILSLDENRNFHPDTVLSRYDFTAALIKMFYSLNMDAVTSFKDVPPESDMYRYIASAEEQGLASGFSDGTFRGKKPALKEQVVTLCGRTLAEKKGYAYPENNEQYLAFSDKDQISEWALGDISVAVQCGLLENSGMFSPAGTVTRAQGAEILYKTFMLLYETSPVTTVPSLQEESAPVQVIQEAYKPDLSIGYRLALCIGITLILVLFFCLLIKTRKYDEKKHL